MTIKQLSIVINFVDPDGTVVKNTLDSPEATALLLLAIQFLKVVPEASVPHPPLVAVELPPCRIKPSNKTSTLALPQITCAAPV